MMLKVVNTTVPKTTLLSTLSHYNLWCCLLPPSWSHRVNSCCSSSKLPFTFPALRWSQTRIQMTSDGTIPYLRHQYRINGISTTEDMAISIPSIHQSYVHFILQTNSISSHQVKWWHPPTTLWHQCWTPLTTFNPSTIQSPSLSQPFNGELGTRVTLPMLQIAMK